MKKDRLARLPLKAPAGKENDILYWKGIVERQLSMLRSYKSRQDDVVLCLGRIQKRPDLADVMIQGLLETTLAVASKRVRDREEALTILREMGDIVRLAGGLRQYGAYLGQRGGGPRLAAVQARLRDVEAEMMRVSGS